MNVIACLPFEQGGAKSRSAPSATIFIIYRKFNRLLL